MKRLLPIGILVLAAIAVSSVLIAPLHQSAVAQQEQGKLPVESLAPFVPTPMEVVDKMLELAEVTKKDVVYDLGCGDGRIVIRAAEKYGTRGVGVDYNPERLKEANARAKEYGVENRVKFLLHDAMTVDLSDASVVTLYLLTQSNKKLQPLLEKYLQPGDRVVSHDFDMEGWKAKKVVTVPDDMDMEHTVYLWVIGEHK